MNKTELLEKIKNGEDSFTQFKVNITRSESLANEFVAFADEAVNVKSHINDIDHQQFYRFFQNKKATDFKNTGLDLATVLQNMNLSDGKHLTLAGILLFGMEPQRFYPMFNIQTIYCKGNNIHNSYIDKKYFQGPIYSLFEQTMRFFYSSLRSIQDKETFNTVGKLEIPLEALKEIVINALIHRDYYINSSIKIFIFDNRVEIISPGKLPNSLTVEKIKNGLSVARNPIFHSIAPFILSYSGFGTGIERVISLYENVEFINDTEKEQFITIFYRVKNNL